MLTNDVPEEAAQGLMDMLPQDPHCLPILQATESASISFHTDPDCTCDATLICKTTLEDGRTGQITVQFLVDRNSSRSPRWEYSLDALLSDFCTLFGASPLTKLSLALSGNAPEPAPSAYAFVEVFRSFPRISTLELSYRNWATAETLRIDELTVALSGSLMTLPQLRVLRIKHLWWRRDILASMFDCLKHRAQVGFRLDELDLELAGRDRGPRLDAVHDRMIQALSTVSGAVTCRDVVPARY